MKKCRKFFLVLLLISFVGCSNAAGTNSNEDEGKDSIETDQSSSENEKIVLKVSTHSDTNHYTYTLGAKPWMDKVTELTNGQVEFEFFPNGQLGSEGDVYQLLKSKTTDIAFASNLTQEMPLTNLPSLAGMYETSYEGTKAYWDITSQGTLFDMWTTTHGIRPIFSWTMPPYTISTVEHKIESLEDFEGLVISSVAGGIMEFYIQGLGASPTQVSMVETRESLERGVIDGVLLGWNSIIPYQLEEVIGYGLSDAPLNGWGGFYAINEEVYQSLPQDVKDAMSTASEEVVLNIAEKLNEENQKNMEIAKEAGVEISPLDETELERWEEQLLPINDEWIQDMEEQGLPAQEVYDQFKDAVEKYKE